MKTKLEELISKAKTLHLDIAKDVYPNGGELKCKICGYKRLISVEVIAIYLKDGWPQCCGETLSCEPIRK